MNRVEFWPKKEWRCVDKEKLQSNEEQYGIKLENDLYSFAPFIIVIRALASSHLNALLNRILLQISVSPQTHITASVFFSMSID